MAANPAHIFRLAGWALRAVVRAGGDAWRAGAVVPHVHGLAAYERNQNGGWRLKRRRQFRLNEVVRLKLRAAKEVFKASTRIGLARDVVVSRYHEEGLLANLLHALEVIHRVRPDARVHVDWTLTGKEAGFRYGKKGDDVWGQLFRPVGEPPKRAAYPAWRRLDMAFWGKGKDYLTGRRLQRHREAYHSTALKWLEITSPRVLGQVEEIAARSFDGCFCIGVHRRVGNVLVAELQKNGRIPSLESVIETVESCVAIATREISPNYAVFLATDDADAVETFKRASFGPRLVVRDDVQRTTADGAEVHFGDWGNLSITDAEDVLIDTLLLSQCNVLIHMSSSVSTVAAILNPDLILMRA